MLKPWLCCGSSDLERSLPHTVPQAPPLEMGVMGKGKEGRPRRPWHIEASVHIRREPPAKGVRPLSSNFSKRKKAEDAMEEGDQEERAPRTNEPVTQRVPSGAHRVRACGCKRAPSPL